MEETDILTNKYNTMVRCSERTNAPSIMKAQGTVSNPLWVGVWGGACNEEEQVMRARTLFYSSLHLLVLTIMLCLLDELVKDSLSL